jgi:hypothetical protein
VSMRQLSGTLCFLLPEIVSGYRENTPLLFFYGKMGRGHILTCVNCGSPDDYAL